MRFAFAVLALAALALSSCGEQRDPAPTAAAPRAERPPQPEPAEGGCKQVERPEPRPPEDRQAPRKPLEKGKTYEATVRTSCGEFSFELDVEAAPKTSASFVALAENDFYDGLSFHRIVPGFVIQGGDPEGTGEGGPGYQTVDAPPSDAGYGRGVVAMAKASNEDPGTAGSQFFVVTAEDAGLPPDYAILGKVTDGLDVVERIGALGDPSDQAGAPTQTVTIEDIAVERS